MISVGSSLKIIDNSGAKYAKCIRVLGKVGRNYGYVGDIVVVTIREVYSGKKIKKGEIYRGVIVRVTKGFCRLSGDYISFADNSIVLISKRDLPLGTRILGSVMAELRMFGFTKIVGLAETAL
jgi:large subunit ribosomal protein L14